MKLTRISKWTLSVDPEATRAATSNPEHPSGAEGCGCTYCRNYVAQRDHLYSPAMLDLFDQLGIDYKIDVEVVEYCRCDDGMHEYGIWYHLVGRIEEGSDAWVSTGDHSFHLEVEVVGEGFALGFSNRVALRPKTLDGLPVIQLDISFRIPWVLDEPIAS